MASAGDHFATETGKVFSESTDGCPSVNRVKTSTGDVDEWGVADLSASMPALSDKITDDEPSTNVGVLSTSEPLRARGVEGGRNVAAVGAAEIGHGGGGGSDTAGSPNGEDVNRSSVSDLPSGKNNNVSAPDKRPVRVTAPKKSLFGKFLKKKPSKANVEVPGVDVSVPDTSGGSLPRVSGDVSVPSVGGGLDVAVAVPSADVGATAPFAPSVGVSGGLDVPSDGAPISGDLPSVYAKSTGQGVHVVDDGVSLGAGLAAGVTAAVSATAIGHGVSGTAKKQEGELPRAPDVHLSVPDMPRPGTKMDASVSAPVKQPARAMAPRKSLFGKCLVKKPPNANVQASGVASRAATTHSKSCVGQSSVPYKPNAQAPGAACGGAVVLSNTLTDKLHTPFKASVDAPGITHETQSKSVVGKLHTPHKASAKAPGMTPRDGGATHSSSLVDRIIKKEPSMGISVEETGKPSGSIDAGGSSAPGGMQPVGVHTPKKSLFGNSLKKAPSKP